mmetsp:Transcript_18445/g.25278  ORF Transcript_18445/g.25278 Transcript_18445/m.25278 type:complete len:348 (-) Transcript_18445:222-1265(-)
MFPYVFERGYGEYNEFIDLFLWHKLLLLTSVQAVAAIDGWWQILFKLVATAEILMDHLDESTSRRSSPGFTAMINGMLVIKGETRTFLREVHTSQYDLIRKFHSSAFKLFPRGCSSIPIVLTCNEQFQLFTLSHFHGRFSMYLVQMYDVMELSDRVKFISDIFKILVWVFSQTGPVDHFHLPPGVRTKTRNGHHIELFAEGIYKEFCNSKFSQIDMDSIRKVYSLKLPNVEWGIVSSQTITITRVGSTLSDAIRVRNLNKEEVFEQVCRGVAQLHDNGIAHCDICVDNIFVEFEEKGGQVFLGDLEYCCAKDMEPRSDIRRADCRAKTAEELDNIQLEKLKDELARI